jgi:hypothetical protein
MSNKNIKLNLAGIELLDQETLGMIIDELIAYYANNYGIEIDESDESDEPDVPTFDCENIDGANTYLKKFRLEK